MNILYIRFKIVILRICEIFSIFTAFRPNQDTPFQTGMWSKQLSLVWLCQCKNIKKKKNAVCRDWLHVWNERFTIYFELNENFFFVLYSIPTLLYPMNELMPAFKTIAIFLGLMCFMKCLFILYTSMNSEFLWWTYICTLL